MGMFVFLCNLKVRIIVLKLMTLISQHVDTEAKWRREDPEGALACPPE